jgi:hypothetical protein
MKKKMKKGDGKKILLIFMERFKIKLYATASKHMHIFYGRGCQPATTNNNR